MATPFLRNCGATTGFVSIVAVHSPDREPEDGEHVFVVRGDEEIHVSWDGTNALRIRCAGCPRRQLFKQLVVLDDLDIAYELSGE